ncbi:MAG TPA: hypothetical protein VN843_20050 [Anaerolineales bacterium]|nr:hypothetical protein [Anaerolineales bacterium]
MNRYITRKSIVSTIVFSTTLFVSIWLVPWKSYTPTIEISYAVLMKNDRPLLRFDGVYFGAGNGTESGLFGLLGNGFVTFTREKQKRVGTSLTESIDGPTNKKSRRG